MPTGLQPVPFGHSGTDPGTRHVTGSTRAAGNETTRWRGASSNLRDMPTFDVVSEIDQQEIRNAVDQAVPGADHPLRLQGHGLERRAWATTRSSSSPSARTGSRRSRQVLEEKLVRRKVSLKALDYGKVEDAAGGTVAPDRRRSTPASPATTPASSTCSSRASASRASSRQTQGGPGAGQRQEDATTCRRSSPRSRSTTSASPCSSTTSATDARRRRARSLVVAGVDVDAGDALGVEHVGSCGDRPRRPGAGRSRRPAARTRSGRLNPRHAVVAVVAHDEQVPPQLVALQPAQRLALDPDGPGVSSTIWCSGPITSSSRATSSMSGSSPHASKKASQSRRAAPGSAGARPRPTARRRGRTRPPVPGDTRPACHSSCPGRGASVAP